LLALNTRRPALCARLSLERLAPHSTAGRVAQVLRYQPGAYYRSHHDWVDEHVEFPFGPRVFTFFLYLSDVEVRRESSVQVCSRFSRSSAVAAAAAAAHADVGGVARVLCAGVVRGAILRFGRC
jgi:hypothetical protein